MLPISVVVSLTRPHSGSCLGQLLRDLRHQTVQPFETIVVGGESYLQETLRTIMESGARMVTIPDPDCTDPHALNLGVAAANCSVVACLRHDASPLSPTWLQEVIKLFHEQPFGVAFPLSAEDENRSDPCQAVITHTLAAEARWQEGESLAEWVKRLGFESSTLSMLDDRVACRALAPA